MHFLLTTQIKVLAATLGLVLFHGRTDMSNHRAAPSGSVNIATQTLIANPAVNNVLTVNEGTTFLNDPGQTSELNLPLDSELNLPLGFKCKMVNIGLAPMTAVIAVGGTLLPAVPESAVQSGGIILIEKVAANTWSVAVIDAPSP